MPRPSNEKLAAALALVSGSVRGLKPYHLEPTDSRIRIKLNQNENPHDWDADVKRQAADFFVTRPWNRYPNFIPGELKAKLARHVGVDASNVIVGNGSNEMLLVLLLSFASKAKTVIICSPTFTVYKLLSDGLGARVENVLLDNDLQYDVPALKQAVTNDPGALLIICSPNNPVGNVISEDDLKSILDLHTGICILDQAYVEFGGFDGVKLLPGYPNLIIARTFSKAMAGAGLRLGYMIGAEELIAQINKIKLPYNINFFSEHAASVILDNAGAVREMVVESIKERDALSEFFKKFPFDKVYPSQANFILVRTSRKQELFDHLCNDGILVRDVSSYPLLENCLRIGVGTPEENLTLRESVKVFFGN